MRDETQASWKAIFPEQIRIRKGEREVVYEWKMKTRWRGGWDGCRRRGHAGRREPCRAMTGFTSQEHTNLQLQVVRAKPSDVGHRFLRW